MVRFLTDFRFTIWIATAAGIVALDKAIRLDNSKLNRVHSFFLLVTENGLIIVL